MAEAKHSLRDLAVLLVVWAVAAAYFVCNLGHAQLVVRIETDAADLAQVFHSPNLMWNELESKKTALEPGRNDVAFALPGLLAGPVVRFDPGRRPTTYRLSAMRWVFGNSSLPIAPESVVNMRPDASSLTRDGDDLVLTARDDDPQVGVPTPGLRQRALLPLALAALALAFVVAAWRRRVAPPKIAGALLALCALLYAGACVTIGPHLPMHDDWRYLLPGDCNIVDGGWAWLGIVGNDTYFLTNQLLDFAVLKLSHVDFGWMRGVAVVLLLLQLAMVYAIVTRAARTAPAVAAVAAMLGIWSLAEGAYWSTTGIAYQQALPTMFGSCMLLQLIDRDGVLRAPRSVAAMLLCCAASGLAYISGGPLIASLGAALVLATYARDAAPRRSGMWLAAAGVLLLVLQVVLVWRRQGSLLEHNHHSESVYPTDWRFWYFYFALFGRALGYGGVSFGLDVFFGAIVLTPAVVLGIERLLPRRQADGAPAAWTMLALYAGLGCASYAAMVAFGRAGFASADVAPAIVTTMGKGRFHFWPIAAMLPYVWLGWAAVIARLRAGRALVGGAVALLMLSPKSVWLLDQVGVLRELSQTAREGARCIVAHLPDAEAQRPVVCTVITSAPVNLGPTLLHLRAEGAHVYTDILDAADVRP
ncbi:MAG TPA: hypothetical protein VFB32_16545 [Rudaea sp.]|nr:hypothetical protein [Rudaea sp.]